MVRQTLCGREALCCRNRNADHTRIRTHTYTRTRTHTYTHIHTRVHKQSAKQTHSLMDDDWLLREFLEHRRTQGRNDALPLQHLLLALFLGDERRCNANTNVCACMLVAVA